MGATVGYTITLVEMLPDPRAARSFLLDGYHLVNKLATIANRLSTYNACLTLLTLIRLATGGCALPCCTMQMSCCTMSCESWVSLSTITATAGKPEILDSQIIKHVYYNILMLVLCKFKIMAVITLFNYED